MQKITYFKASWFIAPKQKTIDIPTEVNEISINQYLRSTKVNAGSKVIELMQILTGIDRRVLERIGKTNETEFLEMIDAVVMASDNIWRYISKIDNYPSREKVKQLGITYCKNIDALINPPDVVLKDLKKLIKKVDLSDDDNVIPLLVKALYVPFTGLPYKSISPILFKEAVNELPMDVAFTFLYYFTGLLRNT